MLQRTFSKTITLYKDAYAGHPREIWALAVLTVINRMGTMVMPFMSVYLTTILGFSLRDAGFIVSAFGIGSLGGSFLGGRFSDRYGPNIVIIVSFAVGGLLFILLQFAMTFWSLFFMVLLASLFGEAYRPAVTTAIAKYVPQEQTGRSVALIRLAINLGMGAAPAVGGFVAVSIGYGGLFWIDGLTCISAALYMMWVSGRWRRRRRLEGKEEEPPVVEEDAPPPYKNISFLFLILATFLIGFAFIQWFHSVPVFIKSEWGFDERYIGLLMAMSSLLIVLIEMPAIHSIEKNKKIRLWVFIGLGLIGSSFLLFLLPKAMIWGVLAIIVLTFGEIFYLPFNSSIALNMSPAGRKGDYMAWYWSAWSVVNIAGPAAGLSFIDAFGYDAFWLLLPCMAVASLAIHKLVVV